MKSETWPAVSFTWDSPVPLYYTRGTLVFLIVLPVKSGACFSTLGHCPAGSGSRWPVWETGKHSMAGPHQGKAQMAS